MPYIIFSTYCMILYTYWNCIRQRYDMKYLYKPAFLKKNKTMLNKILLFLLQPKGKTGFSRIHFYILYINTIMLCLSPIWLIVVYKNKYYEISDFYKWHLALIFAFLMLSAIPRIFLTIQDSAINKYRDEHENDKPSKHSSWKKGGRFK